MQKVHKSTAKISNQVDIFDENGTRSDSRLSKYGIKSNRQDKKRMLYNLRYTYTHHVKYSSGKPNMVIPCE